MNKKIKRPDKLILYANGIMVLSRVISASEYVSLSKFFKQNTDTTAEQFYDFCNVKNISLKLDYYFFLAMFKPGVVFKAELKRYEPI